MKSLIKVFFVLLIVTACNPGHKSGEVKDLLTKRDSLLMKQLKIQKEINKIEAQIETADTSMTKDDLKIMKKITMQKNKIAATQVKIKKMEANLTSEHTHSLTPVAVKEIAPEEFNHYIKVYGKVEADNYAQISPEMGGRVETIHVEEGQYVSKGTLLVSLNTSAVEKQIQGVKSSLELATTTFEKQKKLWDQGIGSEIQFLSSKNSKENLEAQLEALEAQKRMAQIRAPFAGTVDKIYLKKGELAAPGFPVVEFVNLSNITVKADIPEQYISEVKAGQKVGLSFASLPDYVVTTPVRRVSQVIDPKSRTFEIELKMKNVGNRIKPNMVSTIQINDFTSKEAFVVPSLIIRKDITGDYVYVVHTEEGEDVIRKKYIQTGMSYDDDSLIEEGLESGDRVVVKGFHQVSTGIPVRVVE
jgi:RND family efflux transporter MFP subunit